MLIKCNICGCSDFEPAFNGRLSINGQPPQCRDCKSLERHRAMRSFFERLKPTFADMRCLQFSWDPSLDPSWFKKFDVSYYGGQNSLDITKINLPGGSYDFVFASHIIEFIEEDHSAFRELNRILSPLGVLAICFASPQRRNSTVNYPDFSGPTESRRQYGKDRAEYFTLAVEGLEHIEIRVKDPLTGLEDFLDIFTRSAFMRHRIVSTVYQQVAPTEHIICID